jgi:hypothetical protein
MSEAPEFKLTVQIYHKGKSGVRHILAVTLLLLVLLAPIVAYILYLLSH